MRIAFVNTLTELAKSNKHIILLTGDLGFSVFENFQIECDSQYFNCGVAEQNMTGVAAGFAIEGYIPVMYSIIPFVTMRNFEQIRNDICYQNLNVKIVGVGSGFSYGIYGHTHYGLEDIGILRTIPNMTIFSPGDPVETELVTRAAFTINGPVYIRLGKAGEPTVHKIKPVFTIGKGIIIKKGRDIALLSTGTMVPVAVEVAELLKNKYSVCVVSMHTIKPLDEILVKELARKMRGIFTLEEHTIIGGLGGAVAEILAENNSKNVFRRFGSPDQFNKLFGSQQYMREKNGLSATCIVKEIQRIVK